MQHAKTSTFNPPLNLRKLPPGVVSSAFNPVLTEFAARRLQASAPTPASASVSVTAPTSTPKPATAPAPTPVITRRTPAPAPVVTKVTPTQPAPVSVSDVTKKQSAPSGIAAKIAFYNQRSAPTQTTVSVPRPAQCAAPRPTQSHTVKAPTSPSTVSSDKVILSTPSIVITRVVKSYKFKTLSDVVSLFDDDGESLAMMLNDVVQSVKSNNDDDVIRAIYAVAKEKSILPDLLLSVSICTGIFVVTDPIMRYDAVQYAMNHFNEEEMEALDYIAEDAGTVSRALDMDDIDDFYANLCDDEEVGSRCDAYNGKL